jgi:PAS domain S-box-containing protein
VAESLTGWSAADAVGRRLEEIFVIVHEETRRPGENPVQRAWRDGALTNLANHTLIAKDGREIPIEDSASPIRMADGMIGVILVFRDITQRRRDEQERSGLLEQERLSRIQAEVVTGQLRTALEAGRMGTWEFLPVSNKVHWSPGLEAIHGYEPGTFPQTFEAFRNEIHPDDREAVLRAIGDAIEHDRGHHVEYRIVRRDGSVRWVEGRGQLFRDAAGRPERMVGVCTDVTERKLAEEQVRLAVEASPAAMIMVDHEGRVIFVNATTERLLGYDRQEMTGMQVEDLVPERFRDRHSGFRHGFHRDLQARPMGVGRDLFALRKDGAEVPVEIGLTPIETADGAIIVAAITDIAERKRVESALMGAKAAAEEASR